MIEIRQAHPSHLGYIVVGQEQSDEYRALWKPGYAEQLVRGHAYTAWASYECVGAAGISVSPEWPERGEAWTIFGSKARYYILPIVRAMRRVLDECQLRRVDMLVGDGNVYGHKLAKLCGFEYEAKLEKYHPTGVDATMYKRIKR